MALCALSVQLPKLNLDGPKFQFLLLAFVKSFEKSAADAPGKRSEVNRNKTMKQIEEQIEAAMPEILSSYRSNWFRHGNKYDEGG